MLLPDDVGKGLRTIFAIQRLDVYKRQLKDRPRIRRYRVPFYGPGSAELFNSSVDRIAKNPAVASCFERITFVPLAGITQMVPPGGDGIGMHVSPVEKAIDAKSESVDLEHISYWLQTVSYTHLDVYKRQELYFRSYRYSRK